MNLEFLFYKEGLGGALSPTFLNDLKKLSRASVFIETGTYFGNTVESVRENFEKVISVELSPELHQKATIRFKDYQNVTILQGDSESRLRDALTMTDGQVRVIWLDAHYSGEGTSKALSNTPIIGELTVISELSKGTDIILIDDIRMFGKVADGFLKHDAIDGYPDLSRVVMAIEKMGNGYDCYIIADILLAMPRVLASSYTASPTLKAITQLKLGNNNASTVSQLEHAMLANITDQERETIIALPDVFAQQLDYGLGGDFCYWRYLLHKSEGSVQLANQDYILWQKCISI